MKWLFAFAKRILNLTTKMIVYHFNIVHKILLKKNAGFVKSKFEVNLCAKMHTSEVQRALGHMDEMENQDKISETNSCPVQGNLGKTTYYYCIPRDYRSLFREMDRMSSVKLTTHF